MTDYAIKEASSTSSGGALIVSALLMLQLQLGVGQSSQADVPFFRHPAVQIEENSKTFGQYTSLFTEEEDSSLSFEEAVASFYAQLLSKQEPLGREFEQVLYDNLDALLVRT